MQADRQPPPALSGGEAVAAAMALTACCIIVAAYLVDLAGMRIMPTPIGCFGAAAGIGLLLTFSRRARWDAVELITFLAIVLGTFGWLMWLARPLYLPVAGGDQTHHLLLIDYIERHWRLARPSLKNELNEFAFYTPGGHVLVALVGAWIGTNGFHVLHAVVAATIGLKAGFVFLIGRRILPRDVPRTPLAAVGAIALFASPTFFLGSFLFYGFHAQVMCEWLAVAMWWAIVVWDEEPRRQMIACIGLLAVGVFLTWPILLGPPLVVLGALVVLPHTVPVGERLRAVVRALLPLGVIALTFAYGRARYAGIIGAPGDAPHPAWSAYAWWFLVLSSAGLVIAVFQTTRAALLNDSEQPRTRTLAVIAAAILAESAAFRATSFLLGREPYMAHKMFYFLIYAQALGAAVAVSSMWRAAARHRIFSTAVGRQGAWILVAAAVALVAVPLKGMRQLVRDRPPAISLPLYEAGQWARARVPVGCVEYPGLREETAYWLHLAVLGNPRWITPDGQEAYRLRPPMVAWPHRNGEPYAIADLEKLPPALRNEFEVVAQFGPGAVLKRRAAAMCVPPS